MSFSFFSTVVVARHVHGVSASLLQQPEPRRLPPHGHAWPYFSLLVSGSYVERAGARVLEHRAASVVYHPAELEHVDAYGEDGGRMLVVQLDPARSSWLESHGPRDPTVLRGRGALAAAWRVYRALDPDLPPLALEEAAADLLSQVESPERVGEANRPAWLDRVVERLRHEYASPPSLAELAGDAGVHASHLSRTLRRFEGRGIPEIVQQARVEHVWRQLVATNAPSLVDVSLGAGFADQSHCSRVFRRFVGASPGTFRKLGHSSFPVSGPSRRPGALPGKDECPGFRWGRKFGMSPFPPHQNGSRLAAGRLSGCCWGGGRTRRFGMERRQFLSTGTIATTAILAASTGRTRAAEGEASVKPVPAELKLRPAQGPIDVAFCISQGSNVIDMAGPWEVFQDVVVDGDSPFRLFTVAEKKDSVRATGGLHLIPDHTFEDAPTPRVVVVPAIRGTEGLWSFLRKMSTEADLVMSVCTGAFQLARAGLLDGRKATTHHEFWDEFAKTYPKVTLERGPRYVEHAKVATAGGLTSGIDLALRVVERYFDRATAQTTATYMEYRGDGWRG